MVLGDAELTAGDCRVDWGDGSAERKSEAIWAEMDDIIKEAFAAHGMDEQPTDEAPPHEAPLRQAPIQQAEDSVSA